MADEDENYDVDAVRGHRFQNNDEVVYWVKWSDIPGMSQDWPAEQDYVNEPEMSCPGLIQQYWLDFRDRVVMTLPLTMIQRRTLELFIGRKIRECHIKSQWYEEHMYSEDYYDCPITAPAPVPKFLLHPILRAGEKDCYGRPLKNNHRVFEVMLRDFFSRTGFYSHTVHLFALKCFYSGGSNIPSLSIKPLLSSNEEFRNTMNRSSEEKTPSFIVNKSVDYLEELIQPLNHSDIKPEMAKYYTEEERDLRKKSLLRNLRDGTQSYHTIPREDRSEDKEGTLSFEEAIAKYKALLEPANHETFTIPKLTFELIHACINNMHYWNTDEEYLIDDIYKIEQFPSSESSLKDLYTSMMLDMFKTACEFSSTALLEGFDMVDVLLIVKEKSSSNILCLTVHRNVNYELEGVYIPFKEALSINAELVERCFLRQRQLAQKSG